MIVRAWESVSIPRDRSQRVLPALQRGAPTMDAYVGGNAAQSGWSRVTCRKRSIEALKSSGRTGRPSENRSPRRSVKT